MSRIAELQRLIDLLSGQ